MTEDQESKKSYMKEVSLLVVGGVITLICTSVFYWMTTPNGANLLVSWEDGAFEIPPINENLRPRMLTVGGLEKDPDEIRLDGLEDYIFPLEKYQSFATFVITNNGDQIAKNAFLRFPSNGLAIIEGEKSIVNETIDLGDIRAGIPIEVKFWSERRWDVDEFPVIGHSIGSPKKLTRPKTTDWILTLALCFLTFAVGFRIKSFFGVND